MQPSCKQKAKSTKKRRVEKSAELRLNDRLRESIISNDVFAFHSSLLEANEQGLLGFNINPSGYFYALGDSLMQTAASAGNLGCVGELLDAGVSPGRMNLQLASTAAVEAFSTHEYRRACGIDIGHLLMEVGADPSGTGSYEEMGMSSIHRVIGIPGKIGDIAAALFLRHGADPNVHDELGRTPLHWAAAIGNVRSLVSLLRSGADPNEIDVRKRTPLFDALYGGHTAAVVVLLAAGAVTDPVDDCGCTALQHCQQQDVPRVGASYVEVAEPPPPPVPHAGLIRSIVLGVSPRHSAELALRLCSPRELDLSVLQVGGFDAIRLVRQGHLLRFRAAIDSESKHRMQ